LAPIITLREEAEVFSYGCLFGGLDLCETVWPQAKRIISCDKWNRKDVTAERVLTKTDHQLFGQVNWAKKLKTDIPSVLMVQQPGDANFINEWEKVFCDEADHRSPVLLVLIKCRSLYTKKGAITRTRMDR
jgi:hypothetical protein